MKVVVVASGNLQDTEMQEILGLGNKEEHTIVGTTTCVFLIALSLSLSLALR